MTQSGYPVPHDAHHVVAVCHPLTPSDLFARHGSAGRQGDVWIWAVWMPGQDRVWPRPPDRCGADGIDPRMTIVESTWPLPIRWIEYDDADRLALLESIRHGVVPLNLVLREAVETEKLLVALEEMGDGLWPEMPLAGLVEDVLYPDPAHHG